MNAQQMAAILIVAAGILIIVAIAFEYYPLALTSVPFSVGMVYCTYREDW